MNKERGVDVDIMSDPQRYGYEVCPYCIGQGESLHDPAGGCKCWLCGGLGLVKKDNVKEFRLA
jgi:hypothetical protein